ncbi:hypothetical protein PR048_025514 [Dryococelus australis]|uniref:Uncharacterized protein n=1 Tax=Dryococelus australis TaxID=614101 RepID=A0ABQ9GRL1_9NEOP|nr:hypothetical protein PR048_025514 [Dryococelus australis]
MQMDEASSRLTTFWGPYGERYEWLRYPFRLSTAPDDFQRALMETLRGLKEVAVIADDILRAQASNLKFNPEKYTLHERQVTYMGHVLSADGLKANPHKVQAIQDIQPPTTVKDLQRFLVMLNYLATFLMSLATISRPLQQLAYHGTTWMWDTAQQQTFVNIKTTISTTPWTRHHPLAQLTASKLCIKIPHKDGIQLGADRERNTRKFSLNATASITTYVVENIVAHADHQPLEIIFKKTRLSTPKHIQYTFKYKKGKELYLADKLSRAPVQEDLN